MATPYRPASIPARNPSAEPARYGLDDLVQFGLIAEAGGITAASRRHGLPKTNLSRAVARLEQAAGVALFDRVGRGLKLTAFGTRLTARAADALRVSRDTERTLLDVLGEPQGALRIGSSVHTSLVLAAPVVAKLQRRWPGVETSMQLVAPDANPYDEELDVMLSVGRPDDPNLVARRILSLERRLYTSKVLGEDIDPGDARAVARLPRIVVGTTDEGRDWHLEGPAGARVTIDSVPAVIAQDASVVLDVVRHGSGMALLSRLFVERGHAHDELTGLLPGFRCHATEIYACFPPHRTEVPAVRAFVDLLVEHAAEVEESGDDRTTSVPHRETEMP